MEANAVSKLSRIDFVVDPFVLTTCQCACAVDDPKRWVLRSVAVPAQQEMSVGDDPLGHDRAPFRLSVEVRERFLVDAVEETGPTARETVRVLTRQHRRAAGEEPLRRH